MTFVSKLLTTVFVKLCTIYAVVVLSIIMLLIIQTKEAFEIVYSKTISDHLKLLK